MEAVGEVIKKRGGVEMFRGFAKPNTTPTPDDIFDVFLTELSHAELKILLYIVRRTFGFKKSADDISLKQICNGIIKKNGERLDYGAGVNRRTAQRVLRRLEEKGLINVKHRQSKDGHNLVNVYSLRFRGG